MRLSELWVIWCMMQKMRCTYTEFMAQPHAEMLVFEAFVRGEAEAESMKQQRAEAEARNRQSAGVPA